MSRLIGSQERGCLSIGGSRPSSTWRGRRKKTAEAAMVFELESDLESNSDPGREDESKGASGSSGAE